MKIKSKVNGLVIGNSKTTNDVVKLGRGKYADVVVGTSKSPSKPQTKRVAAQKKTAAKSDVIEQL